jgi:hypothetical protein
MKYQTFFEVKIEHPFTTSILEYVAIRPTISTTKFLQGRGLIFKQTKRGFRILVPTKGENNALPIFQADEKLMFSVFSSSSDFLGFTDFPLAEEDKVLLFSNESFNSGGGDLLISEVPGNAKLNGFPQVGQIEIVLNSVEVETDQNAPLYTVRFDVKSIIWKYYFITKDDTDALSVKNKGIIFKQLSDETADPVFNKLKANFTPAGLHIKAFQSDEALACQSFPRKDIQLKNENTTLISHLPNPEFSDRGIQIIRIN